jgi:hypothetical protein
MPRNWTLLERAAAHDATAVGELFELYRDRLRRLVHIRIDRRLKGRLDPSRFALLAQGRPRTWRRPDRPSSCPSTAAFARRCARHGIIGRSCRPAQARRRSVVAVRE